MNVCRTCKGTRFLEKDNSFKRCPDCRRPCSEAINNVVTQLEIAAQKAFPGSYVVPQHQVKDFFSWLDTLTKEDIEAMKKEESDDCD